MRDTELYAQILGVRPPWVVSRVVLELDGGDVEVFVEHGSDEESLACPECGKPASRYDKRQRRWRHLDTCQYRTILVADVPRVRCSEHGVKTIRAPWSEPGSSFTALFEALVIDWLREATTTAVAHRLGLTWDQVDGVMQRAVRRGLARRTLTVPRHLGVDETSFQRRHDYVTVVADLGRGVVHHVADGRGKASLAAYYDEFSEAELAMEMWESRDRQGAAEIFQAWYNWAVRSRLEPIKTVARTLKRHLTGIPNAIASGLTNARLEGINTVIQGLKRSARGFRNRSRFRTAIYFHLGGLQLYPAAIAHSNS